MIHVYAFAEQLEDLPPVDGLDGAPLERVRVDDVDAVFSRRTAETSRDSLRSDAVAHGEVVEALTSRAAVIAPVRFGELVSDESALAQSLRDRLPALRRAFDRVRGCVEVAVRVHDRAEPVADRPTSGAAYMRSRAAAESERRESVDELHRQLKAVARDARIDRASAAFLVPASRLDDVRRTVDGFAASHPDLTLVCTGPWAPFSFVEDAA
jgi:Gas vesicle synthesis protein GvpL/GvpF